MWPLTTRALHAQMFATNFVTTITSARVLPRLTTVSTLDAPKHPLPKNLL